ncbi:sortase [Aquibacillus halophilus]|uniref:Sortase n=1 Tax=Aquibacillus halophilus TaxID=930132 RepID=A0A6A8DB56_9BACI|nr:class D sortase [Aquibacillus halophilus]MRH42744.1 sortase [Aquibacillus halophilus]
MKTAKRTVGILFILIGIGLVGYPFYYHWEQQQEIDELTSSIHAISTGGDIEVSPKMRKKLEDGVMHLKIPSIELNQPVLSETNEENLNIALTQIKTNQTPGQGNFTIAGHRSMNQGRHFNRLPEVTTDEKIILVSDNKEYHYIAYEIATIEPEDIEVLEDMENKKQITLITCNTTGTKRVMVKGELEKIVDLESA